jgi:hypothetical protein
LKQFATTRTCSKCKIDKNISEFYRSSDRRSGVRSHCKECLSTNQRKDFYAKDGYKKCFICLKVKEVSDFPTQKSNLDKLHFYCSVCYKDYRRKIKQKNRRKIREQQRCYRQTDRFKQLHAEWHQKNKEKMTLYYREYDRKNPHKKRRKTIKRRTLSKTFYVDLPDDFLTIVLKRFGNRCYLCGRDDNLCIDHHYPLNRGYPMFLRNAVVLCNSCNPKKGKKLPEDFYDKDKLDYLHTLGILDYSDINCLKIEMETLLRF